MAKLVLPARVHTPKQEEPQYSSRVGDLVAALRSGDAKKIEAAKARFDNEREASDA